MWLRRFACYLDPMALTATLHRFAVQLSDVDRNVYESLELRLARHPSESLRYLFARTLAYALSYEPGIAFSKGGISSTNEAPISIRDDAGRLLAWIEVGAPSAERLHKARKAAERVELYAYGELVALRKEASSIHKVESIAVWPLDPALLDALGEKIDRNMELEILRNDERLYLTIAGQTLESALVPGSLVSE